MGCMLGHGRASMLSAADFSLGILQGMNNLPGLSVEGATKGAYIVKDAEGGKPDIILMGTGAAHWKVKTFFARLMLADICPPFFPARPTCVHEC